MDIVERLKQEFSGNALKDIADQTRVYVKERHEAANTIERLRGALKTFADNVRKTNSGIDKNWAKTIYPLKAENQRLREALKQYRDGHYSGYVTLPCGWDDEGTLASYALKGFDVATYVNDCEKAYAKLKEDE